jgi:hypothetical protein
MKRSGTVALRHQVRTGLSRARARLEQARVIAGGNA